MLCNFPWRHVLKDGTVKYLPCGTCVGCKIAHSREWAFRIMAELRTWNGKALFLTFTYDQDHLPDDQGLHKDHLQKFWKRLRKGLSGRKIMYYACGEYGDRFKRPHYHAIVFGVDLRDLELIEDCWRFGFVGHGSVTYDSARYVAGYIDKKFGTTTNKQVYGDLQPPYQACSQGIGYRYFLAHKDEIMESGITLHGSRMSIPRYFSKKFELEICPSDDFRNELRQVARELGLDPWQLEKYIQSKGNQKALNYNSKRQVYQSVRLK